MTTPRALLVDPDHALHYHIVSRCVRQSWLCGWDKRQRKDYSHRKLALERRLFRLTRCFAVELHGFAIMSNHFHLVLRYDPNACLEWSANEVAERWVAATASQPVFGDPHRQQAQIEHLLADPKNIERLRHRLGSLSAFMQQLKQPIARGANLEDGVTGHFFEQRFYSGALLSERALVAAMAYVDLNPVRARIAKDIEQCKHTSIAKRLEENSEASLNRALQPLASGLNAVEDEHSMSMTLGEYIEGLRELIAAGRGKTEYDDRLVTPRIQRWAQNVATLARRQRAFGHIEQLHHWLARHGMRALETPFA